MVKHQHIIGGGLAVLTLGLGTILVFEDGPKTPVLPAEQTARAGDVFVGPVGGITDGRKPSVTGNKIGDSLVTASVSPILSPMSPSVAPIITATPVESAQPTPSTTPRAMPTTFPSPKPSMTAVSSPQASPTSSPSSSVIPSPLRQVPVVMSEIAWMGTKKSYADEWVELYNPNEISVSLEGWVLRSETDGTPSIQLSGSVAARGFYILERTNDDPLANITADWKGSFGSGGLKDTGEKLVLMDDKGVVQDRTDLNTDGKWYAGDPVTKASMERIDPGAPGDSPQNWRTSSYLSTILDQARNRIIGTPGFME